MKLYEATFKITELNKLRVFEKHIALKYGNTVTKEIHLVPGGVLIEIFKNTTV